jgi:CheY-like chemotaxis protein
MSQQKVELSCIIDDDKLYLKIIQRIIKSKELCEEIIVFKNGKEAIEHFESIAHKPTEIKIPDIIFLDLNMPVMDGWEFLDAFLKIPATFQKNITLYVVSSSIDPRDINRAKSISLVTDYLVKPISYNELKKVFSGNY